MEQFVGCIILISLLPGTAIHLQKRFSNIQPALQVNENTHQLHHLQYFPVSHQLMYSEMNSLFPKPALSQV